MVISNDVKEKMKEFEGLRLHTYKAVATEKYYTCGYGRYGIKEPTTITKETAEKWFEEDVKKFEKQVTDILTQYGYTDLLNNQDCFSALVSFTFNLGNANLQKLLDYGKRTAKEIHDKIPAYCNAGGKPLEGLKRRRKYEQLIFACGMLGIGQEGNDTTEQAQDLTYYFDYFAKVNYCLRRKPDYGANTIRVTKKNEKVQILGMHDKEWVYVEVLETKEKCYLHKAGLFIEIMKA